MCDNQNSKSQQLSKEKALLSKLFDIKRQQVLLESPRLLDHETFIREFKSWEQPDAELIKDYVLNHNEQAFTDLDNRYRHQLFRYALAFVGDEEDAKDIVQDVLILAWEEIIKGNYREKEKFSNWLFSLAKNLAIDASKHKRRLDKNAEMPESPDRSMNAEQQVIDREERALLHQLINRLPDRERQIVLLRLENRTFHEIAVMLHISVSAARGMHCRAVNKMRKWGNGQ